MIERGELLSKNDRVKIDAIVIDDHGDEIVVEVKIESLRGSLTFYALRKHMERAK